MGNKFTRENRLLIRSAFSLNSNIFQSFLKFLRSAPLLPTTLRHAVSCTVTERFSS